MTSNKKYVDEAEAVVTVLRKACDNNGKSLPMITTSQIRNLLAMAAEIYNDVRLLRAENLDAATLERVAYLRMRCVYEAGRNEAVRRFIDKSGILNELKDIKTKDDFVALAHYMEALVAWHRYNGGND